MPPIVVKFVTVVHTDWAMIVVLLGLVVAVVSSFAAREYRREIRLPRTQRASLFEYEPVVNIEPDPQVVQVARAFSWVSRVGLVTAALGAVFIMLR